MINEFGLKNYPEDKLATVKPIFVSRNLNVRLAEL